ncbi:hypothetical protein, partial [Klebsiella pneumoniae]|uniref:hypothetical protein n=1 Tax=Klebsiella pneumoniae TaxID=573 RepID=UPI0024DE7EA6
LADTKEHEVLAIDSDESRGDSRGEDDIWPRTDQKDLCLKKCKFGAQIWRRFRSKGCRAAVCPRLHDEEQAFFRFLEPW